MAQKTFDAPSIGKARFAIGTFIFLGLTFVTILLYSYSRSQLLLGTSTAILFFLLRRILLGEKRFSQRRSKLPFGVLTLLVAVFFVGFYAATSFAPDAFKLTIPPNATWTMLTLTVAMLIEFIEGYFFYARRSPRKSM